MASSSLVGRAGAQTLDAQVVADMRLEAIELRIVALPLVTPFRTSFGTEVVKEAIVLRAVTDVGEGWGECVAMTDPFYSSEFIAGAADVLRRWLAPALFAAPELAADRVRPLTEFVKEHRMAKAALEMAVLDAELRAAGQSLGSRLGATADWVPSGVSVGIHPSIPELVDAVDGYLAEGYRRIKLKIEPGFDVEPVRAVRERIGPDVPLQVDANTAYTVHDADHLAALDEFDLLLIEQPLAEDDIAGHVQLAKRVRTPICLDESILSAAGAVDAIDRGACSVVNIKAGRVGGYLEAVHVHDACRERGVPVWCGGMVETGLGRAANVALAALPGFTLPGDTSGSDRFFTTDLTEPLALRDGGLDVPTAPGIGAEPVPERLEQFTTHTEWLRPS